MGNSNFRCNNHYRFPLLDIIDDFYETPLVRNIFEYRTMVGALELSKRCDGWLNNSYALMEGMKLAMQEPFDIASNPGGCINLGTAENLLMIDMLQAKLAECKDRVMDLQLADIRYSDMTGLPQLRKATADFLNRQLSIPSDLHVESNQITYHNGCGSAVESLFHVLCDRGDVVITLGPYYGGFDMDVERRADVNLVVASTDHNGFKVSQKILESALQEARNDAKDNNSQVRALLIMNPHNPLGTIYTQQEMDLMLQFCQDHELQFVVDEIYAFSVFNDPEQSFKSVLSMERPWRDYRENTHFLWGFSKDFCLNGFRAGVIVSKNPRVIKGLGELSYFTSMSTLMMKLFTELLSDHAWASSFISTNRMRLSSAYHFIVNRIDNFNYKQANGKHVRYTPAQAGFFLWIDVSDFLFSAHERRDTTVAFEREKNLFLDFIQMAKVYLAPGHFAFHSTQAGSFRIIFASSEKTMSMALDRMFSHLIKLDTVEN